LQLGNVQGGDVVIVRLAYLQTTERIGSEQRLRIPVCPGVRYIPGRPLLRGLSGKGVIDDTDQVPDASRISPPRIDALHPDAAYFAAEGVIRSAGVAEGTLSSPTHPLRVQPDGAAWSVALADGAAVPDRDLVICWDEPKPHTLQSRAWTATHGDHAYALVQMRAPEAAAAAARPAQDFYFLVDRSGSMDGAKWTQTCVALNAFVRLLGEQDRVWITLFESHFQDFAEKQMSSAELLRDAGFLGLAKLGTGGGTELLPAVEHVLERIGAGSSDRTAVAVLITDGQVGNEAAILSAFRRHPQVAVFVFGIDTAVNDSFLKQLARQSGGECTLQTPHDPIARTVAQLAHRLATPVLTGLRLGGAWKAAADQLPNLYAGQVIELPLRRVATGKASLKLVGIDAAGREQTFVLEPQPLGNDALQLLWARERITTLLDRDPAGAIALAKEHNLLCEGAAFIAWDESEKVPIAQAELCQPSLEMPTVLMSSRLCEENAFLARSSHVARCYSPAPRPMKRKASLGEQVPALIAAGVHLSLAEELVAWTELDPAESEQRRKLLDKLVRALKRPGIEVADKLRLCREFIERHFQGDAVQAAVAFAALSAWQTSSTA
ncbi:MAG: VWA domain-containing protein, partial [Verrucomicrobiota bacterium]|nr:VWA domain-containing protein [Verrucomicrobiota bacterium]